MTNQVILIGRLVNIQNEKAENGGNKVVVTMAIPQTFKNIDGAYDTNFVNCTLFGMVAKNTFEWCRKGDLIAIRGRVQRIDTEKSIEIIGEKVSFLSSRKESDGE